MQTLWLQQCMFNAGWQMALETTRVPKWLARLGVGSSEGTTLHRMPPQMTASHVQTAKLTDGSTLGFSYDVCSQSPSQDQVGVRRL